MSMNDNSVITRKAIPWWTFLLVSLVLIASGAASILLPYASTYAVGTVLGGVLVIIGIVKTVQSFSATEWRGFLSQLFLGAVELVGGILLYFNPLKGAAAITLLVAIVFVALGLSQIGLALKIKPQQGWGWLSLAGLFSMVAGIGLVIGFRHVKELEAGVIAGVALLFSGLAYGIIALAVRRAQQGGAAVPG